MSKKNIVAVTEIIKMVRLPYKYCKRYLSELIDDGIVDIIKVGKRQLYRLKRESPFATMIAQLVSALSNI